MKTECLAQFGKESSAVRSELRHWSRLASTRFYVLFKISQTTKLLIVYMWATLRKTLQAVGTIGVVYWDGRIMIFCPFRL